MKNDCNRGFKNWSDDTADKKKYCNTLTKWKPVT